MIFEEDALKVIKAALENTDDIPQDITEKVSQANFWEGDDIGIVIDALRAHIDEVKRVQKMPEQFIEAYEAEEKYIEFAEDLLNKIRNLR